MRQIGMGTFTILTALTLPSTHPAAKSASDLAPTCPTLAGRTIDADRIGLPSAGGKIASAEIATLAAANGASASYCKVMAAIAPLDPKSFPINIEINLPLEWNGKAVQYGGGGFNGVLITGLDPLRDQPPDLAPPVVRGYMTFGTDSGHIAKELPEIQAFALNDEALVNFAYAAYKKTRDLALEVAGEFYGNKPERLYYFGGSEGGREGLTMAQRFPNDYPDLSEFAGHGGKLILKDNAHDFGKSANNTIAYYKAVAGKMGQESVDRFMRFYVNPGTSHSGAGVSGTDGSAVPRAVDFLGALDAWVTKGDAPGTLMQTAQAPAPPFAVSATRPLCRYPAYPHYQGGPASEAASFACRGAD